jgi:hypothetical protein
MKEKETKIFKLNKIMILIINLVENCQETKKNMFFLPQKWKIDKNILKVYHHQQKNIKTNILIRIIHKEISQTIKVVFHHNIQTIKVWYHHNIQEV